jgi:ribosomal protein L11 methylase PrmA
MKQITGSFRDPSGYVFIQDDKIYRNINAEYSIHYNHFTSSGLKDLLIKRKLLIDFQESPFSINSSWKTLEVEKLNYISYPYEWSFSQFKEAAILTLEIQLECLKHGMILKDSSAFNIQFKDGSPIFIDLLSFEIYEDGMPWNGYKQFITHFYSPLILMSKIDLQSNQFLKVHLDGIPLELTTKLLPYSSIVHPNILINLFAHNYLEKKYANTHNNKKLRQKFKNGSSLINKASIIRHAESLKAFISELKNSQTKSEWGQYYDDTNYSEAGFNVKQDIVTKIIHNFNPKSILDLGSNNGTFSRIVAKSVDYVISADIDPIAVNSNYLTNKKMGVKNIHPIVLDLSNPTASLGWSNTERASFLDRSKVDMALCLALIHHICISNNIPFLYFAKFLKNIAPIAIIEFVPKEDSQVQRLLSSRKDIFKDYNKVQFVESFMSLYTHHEEITIDDSNRTMHIFSS